MNEQGYAVALEALARSWQPQIALSPSEWAAQYRYLSAKSAAEPGRWRNDRIPYLPAIMDSLDPRRDPAEMVVLVASSQVGKSECGLNWIGRTVHQAPGSFLVVFPTEKPAKKWVKARLDQMIATTAELRALIPLGRRAVKLGEAQSTVQEKHGPGFVIYTGSANIEDDLASISVPYVFCDELDRFPPRLEDEGDPLELALRRAATFPRRKAFLCSTPTTEERSRIWPLWLSSSMGRYFVPCPDCGAMQYLRLEQLKWPEGRPKLARYACEACGSLFEERHKTDMLEAGEWRHEHEDRLTDIKGFHVNGLYTPLGLGDTWAQHATAWDRARGDPDKRQAFYNTRLGEVVKSGRERVEWKEIHGRREPYKLRTIPPGCLWLTCGVDVQHDRVEATILGHGRREAVVVVDHTQIYGDPTRDEVWSKLDEYLAAEMLNSFGVRMRIQATAVDSGNWQHEVTNFTRRRKTRGIFAAKGSSVADRAPIGKPTLVDVNFRGETLKRGAEQYQIGVSKIKFLLYRRLKSDAEALPADRHFRFSEDLTEEYFRQLAAEVFDPKEGWHKIYDRNEALDCCVLALAAAYHQNVQIHRARELDFQRQEQLFEPKGAADQKAAADRLHISGRAFMPTPAITK